MARCIHNQKTDGNEICGKNCPEIILLIIIPGMDVHDDLEG
jgi:hypothetical protein